MALLPPLDLQGASEPPTRPRGHSCSSGSPCPASSEAEQGWAHADALCIPPVGALRYPVAPVWLLDLLAQTHTPQQVSGDPKPPHLTGGWLGPPAPSSMQRSLTEIPSNSQVSQLIPRPHSGLGSPKPPCCFPSPPLDPSLNTQAQVWYNPRIIFPGPAASTRPHRFCPPALERCPL